MALDDFGYRTLKRSLINNRKVAALEPALFKKWVYFLLIGNDDGTLPPVPDLAFALRCPESETQEAVDALVSARFIETKKGGSNGVSYVLHDFEEHQGFREKLATSTARTRAFRERQRNANGNAEGTPRARETYLSTSNQNTTLHNTSLQPRSAGVSFSEDDWKKFQKAYPRQDGHSWDNARTEIGKLLAEGIEWLPLIIAAKNYGVRLKRDKMKPEYGLGAANWLKEGHWRKDAPTGATKGSANGHEPPAAVVFEDTDLKGWWVRLGAARESSAWMAKWGPKPETEGCKVPEEAFKTLGSNGYYQPWKPGEAKGWVDWEEYMRKRRESEEMLSGFGG